MSDAAWEASGSHILECINHMMIAAKLRMANSLIVMIDFFNNSSNILISFYVTAMMRTVVKVDDYKNLDERFANVVVQYTEILMSTASSATRRRRNSDLEEDLTCEVVEVPFC